MDLPEHLKIICCTGRFKIRHNKLNLNMTELRVSPGTKASSINNKIYFEFRLAEALRIDFQLLISSK